LHAAAVEGTTEPLPPPLPLPLPLTAEYLTLFCIPPPPSTPGCKRHQQPQHQQQSNAPAAMPLKRQNVLQLDDEPKAIKEPGAKEEEEDPRSEGEGVWGDAQPAATTLPQLQQHSDRLQQQLLCQVVGGGAVSVERPSAADAVWRVIGKRGRGNGEFKGPESIAFDHEGNLVVSDSFNYRIQVLRYRDGLHLRTIGSEGAGNGQFSAPMGPMGIAFHRSGHLLVVDCSKVCVQVLRYSDGAHVRNIGAGQLEGPSGVAIDPDGNVVVCDGHAYGANGIIQVFRLSDGALIRSIFSPGGNGQFSGDCCVAFDDEGNLAVSDNEKNRIQVLQYSGGLHLRTIGSEGAGNGQFCGPNSIVFDRSGDLVVADSCNGRVQVLRYMDGAHVRSFFMHWMMPSGLAIDGDGRIVVCDSFDGNVKVLP